MAEEPRDQSLPPAQGQAPGSQGQGTPPPAPPKPPPESEKSVGELVFDVSERVSALVREEVELAKAEVSEKAGKLLRGSVVGLAAGVFAFLALILAMHGIAWLINDLLFDDEAWPGYFIEAGLFLLVAAFAGLAAYRAIRAGSPPVPEGAIEEAKTTKATFQGDKG